MSLLSICTSALREIGGFNVPTTFYGNTDLTATQCVALTNRVGKTLETDTRWVELVTEHTITTVSGTADYARPTDFRAFANMTQWDRTNQWRLTSAPPAVWQWLKSGITVASAMNRWFAMRGQYISIYPTPTSADTLAFDYYSKKWILKQVDGTTTSEDWTHDNDTSLLDENLITLGLKWMFLQAKGMPYEPEYKIYESMVESAKEDNGGRGMINLGPPRRFAFGSNIPDTGYGQ